VLDAPTRALLQEILRRESRSLLQYAGGAFPWTSSLDRPAWEELRKLIAADREALVHFTQFLSDHRIVPVVPPSFPSSFTTMNFLSLEHLLPILVQHQRQAVDDLERDHARLEDVEARGQVHSLLEMKRQHLQALTKLAMAHPEPVPV
jgi:hypothetical protein